MVSSLSAATVKAMAVVKATATTATDVFYFKTGGGRLQGQLRWLDLLSMLRSKMSTIYFDLNISNARVEASNSVMEKNCRESP